MNWIKENKDGIMILIPFVIIIVLGLLGVFDVILDFFTPLINYWT